MLNIYIQMKEIALFPLNMFLLPGDYTQLYIFEERYQQLINNCLEQNLNFGIPFTSKLNGANMGCEVAVTEVLKRYPGGEMDIIVKGIDVFRLEKFFYKTEARLHPAGMVSNLEVHENLASGLLLQGFKAYIQRHNPHQSEILIKQEFGLFEIARALKMSDLEKLELVQMASVDGMQKYLLNYLRYLELLHEQENHQYQNIYLN